MERKRHPGIPAFRHSASKARVNALMAHAGYDNGVPHQAENAVAS
jgi:hypothetical protein